MAHLLGAENLHLEYPTRVVFDSVTLGVAEGDRIGIVGRNGDGKSSLLAMLAGLRAPDSGQVTRRRGIRVGVLAQADNFAPDETVGHAIVGDLPEHEWAGDARIRGIIAGLVADIPWEGRVDALSGGQRRRTALAALLAGDWDVLMLDDPSAQTGSNLDQDEHTHEVPRNLADLRASGNGALHVGRRQRGVVRAAARWSGLRFGAVSRLAW